MTPEKPSPERLQEAFSACAIPLCFLLGDPKTVATVRRQLPGLTDSACFHRWWDLLGSVQDRGVLAAMPQADRLVAEAFVTAMKALPWRPVADHPHISELPDDDLSALIPLGRKLFAIVERLAGR